jgi:hypothetical protein
MRINTTTAAAIIVTTTQGVRDFLWIGVGDIGFSGMELLSYFLA